LNRLLSALQIDFQSFPIMKPSASRVEITATSVVLVEFSIISFLSSVSYKRIISLTKSEK